MDKHICKAKRTDNGEWVYGYYAKVAYYLDDTVTHVILPMDEVLYPHCEFQELYIVDFDTVCRYTGKEDKNGNPIFENDICKVDVPFGPLNDDGEYKFHNWTTICVFDQFSAGFTCLCLEGYGDFYRWFGTGEFSDVKDELVEVVGNKFDNTELMEEQ